MVGEQQSDVVGEPFAVHADRLFVARARNRALRPLTRVHGRALSGTARPQGDALFPREVRLYAGLRWPTRS
jgi:hypothetical protein